MASSNATAEPDILTALDDLATNNNISLRYLVSTLDAGSDGLFTNLFTQVLGHLDRSIKEEMALNLGIDPAKLINDNNDEMTRMVLEKLIDRINCWLAKILHCELPFNYNTYCFNEKLKILVRNLVKYAHWYLIRVVNSHKIDMKPPHDFDSHSFESDSAPAASSSESQSYEMKPFHHHHNHYNHHHYPRRIDKCVREIKTMKKLVLVVDDFFAKHIKSDLNEIIVYQRSFIEVKFRFYRLVKVIKRKQHELSRHFDKHNYAKFTKLSKLLKRIGANLKLVINNFFLKNVDRLEPEFKEFKKMCSSYLNKLDY